VSDTIKLTGPDLAQGIDDNALAEGVPLVGHVNGEAVMVVRAKGELFAIGAACSHYGGPLAEGLIVGDTVRCPWHHACFNLRSGAVEAAPALNPIPCYQIE
jgi:nitrite reductase/ring-hydroxylating ferredoxin subunit